MEVLEWMLLIRVLSSEECGVYYFLLVMVMWNYRWWLIVLFERWVMVFFVLIRNFVILIVLLVWLRLFVISMFWVCFRLFRVNFWRVKCRCFWFLCCLVVIWEVFLELEVWECMLGLVYRWD